MDKRVVIAAAFSVAILLFWSWLFPTAPRTVPETPPAVESGAVIETPAPGEPAPVPSARPPVDPEGLYEALEGEAVRELTFENDVYRLRLSNQGARVLSWRLNQYTTPDGQPLELLPSFADAESELLSVDLEDSSLTRALREAVYRVDRLPLSDGERIRFSWADGHGIQAQKTLTFHKESYLVDLEVRIVDRGRRLPARVTLGPGFGAQENESNGGQSNYYSYEAALWNDAGQVTHKKNGKFSAAPTAVAGRLRWAGLEDQYFAAVIVPAEAQTDLRIRTVELQPAAAADDDLVEASLIAVPTPEAGARIFVGPKNYRLLERQGDELEKVVWFSSNGLLAWISKMIFFALLWIYDHTIQNYGLAIILATFLLRMLLFPVNQYSMVRMKKTQLQMQRLQPKIKAIRNKFKKAKDAESRGQMNQEMMELYRKEGVNPMGGLSGCLPLFAQFPILMGFYFMLTVAVELRGAPFFGWIQDLSQRDPYWITPLLMGATMFLQQRMAMSKIKDPVQQQQQRVMMIMPFMFTWICLQMPSGMVLYWFVNNLLGIGQQWLVNRQTSRLEAVVQRA